MSEVEGEGQAVMLPDMQYEPELHCRHVVAFASENVPAAHVAQVVLPLPRNEPALHARMKQELEPAAAP